MMGAIFNDTCTHRYALYRGWSSSKPRVAFIGLNPSTANGATNDHTIKKVIKIARYNGYGSLVMLNLFTIISSDPDILLTDKDLVGDGNIHLLEELKKVDKVVACWGTFKQVGKRPDTVIGIVKSAGHTMLYALDTNANFSPKHPLYCRDNQKFQTWRRL